MAASPVFPHEGTIQLIVGPMFSGKTTELLRRTRRFALAQRRCLVVKFAADTRYSECDAATHDGVTHTARSAGVLSELGEDWRDFDVISVDEGQFFPDVVEFAEAAACAGKTVLVCGLDADFRRRPFGRILELVPLSEKVDKLTAVCAECGRDASFTKRVTTDEALEVIGGWEAYRPACRPCFVRRDEPEPAPARTPTKVRALPVHRDAADSPEPSSPASTGDACPE